MHADCLPHASVTVRVNDEALTEYNTENASADDPLTATTFVEAIPGEHFEVQLRVENEYAYLDVDESLSFRVYVDGEKVRSRILSTITLPGTHRIEGATQTKDGVSTLRKLSFAEHTSTDSNVDPSLVKSLAELGTIKVQLLRCRETGTATPVVRDLKGLERNAVPEKALKGRSISNHAKVGTAEVIRPISWVDVTYPHGRAPIATYVFQYRSRRDLEIEGIVERPPSPVPLTERDPDELTPEELLEQNRLFRAERASAARIKQEFQHERRARPRSATLSDGDDDVDDDDEGDVTITSQSDRRRKRARTSAGAVNAIVIDD